MVSVWVVVREFYDGEQYYTDAVSAWTTEQAANDEVARLTRPHDWTWYTVEELDLRE